MRAEDDDAKVSLRAVVADQIRDAIVAGRLPPGHRLREEDIALQYGASRLPVREAFAQLKAEGFISLVRYRGAAVAVPAPSTGAELNAVRQSLEGLAARQAAQRRGGTQAANLRAVVEEGRRQVARREYADLPKLTERFHSLVAQASGNSQLGELLSQLRYKMSWIFRVDLPERSADSWHDHEEILEAIVAGFPTVAEALMVRHVGEDLRIYRHLALDLRDGNTNGSNRHIAPT